MEFKGTKGEWRVAKVITNGTKGYEIHYTDDGECITDHVYELEDAQLIATAPELLKDAIDLLWLVKNHATHEEIQERIYETEKTTNKALGK